MGKCGYVVLAGIGEVSKQEVLDSLPTLADVTEVRLRGERGRLFFFIRNNTVAQRYCPRNS